MCLIRELEDLLPEAPTPMVMPSFAFGLDAKRQTVKPLALSSMINSFEKRWETSFFQKRAPPREVVRPTREQRKDKQRLLAIEKEDERTLTAEDYITMPELVSENPSQLELDGMLPVMRAG